MDCTINLHDGSHFGNCEWKAGDRRRETGDRRRETGDRRRETGERITGKRKEDFFLQPPVSRLRPATTQTAKARIFCGRCARPLRKGWPDPPKSADADHFPCADY